MNISSTSSSGTGDYSRITGLATGMDIDGMVKSMLTSHQQKLDKANQSKQSLEWQQEAYVDIINDLKDFNKYFDVLKSENMLASSNYTGSKVVSSNSNAVTATTLPGAVKGSYEVNVLKLAEAARAQASFSGLNSKQISEINLEDWQGKTVTFIVNGIEKSIILDENLVDENGQPIKNLNSIVSKLNEKIKDTMLEKKVSGEKVYLGDVVELSVEGNTIGFNTKGDNDVIITGTDIEHLSNLKHKLLSKHDRNNTLEDLGVTIGSFNISVKDKKFTIDITEEDLNKSLDSFVNKIRNTRIDSSDETLGKYLNVNYSDLTGKLTIENKSTGSLEGFSIDLPEEKATNFLEKASIDKDAYTGSNAVVEIKSPGESTAVKVVKTTNNFTIDNVSYNLLKTTDSPEELTVSTDATESLDKFKKFIEAYNNLVDKINSKITAKKEYSYTPLTTAQKEEMTESQIKAWEDKAKQGLLRRDNTLTNLLQSLRSAVYETVQGADISITELGISTTSSYNDGGKLQIDEEKFKSAVENKGDLVQKIFSQTGSNSGEQGIFTRFKNIINENIGYDGTLIKKAGYKDTRWVTENDMSKKITDKETLIKKLQRQLSDRQERLYIQFASLEKSMNALNSQSNYLYSTFSAT